MSFYLLHLCSAHQSRFTGGPTLTSQHAPTTGELASSFTTTAYRPSRVHGSWDGHVRESTAELASARYFEANALGAE